VKFLFQYEADFRVKEESGEEGVSKGELD